MAVRDHPRGGAGDGGARRNTLDDEAPGQDCGPVTDGDVTNHFRTRPDPDVIADFGGSVGISRYGCIPCYRSVIPHARVRVYADCGRATKDHAGAKDVEGHLKAEGPTKTVQAVSQKQ